MSIEEYSTKEKERDETQTTSETIKEDPQLEKGVTKDVEIVGWDGADDPKKSVCSVS